jgi:hypothetical protein
MRVRAASPRSRAEIYLTWEFPGYGARLTGAALYRDGAMIYEALQPGNFDSDHVDTVQPNSTHRYHLCFRNPDGERCSVSITASPAPSSEPPTGPLNPPRNVQVTKRFSQRGVTITWEFGTASYYQIQCVDISAGSLCRTSHTTADGNRGLFAAESRERETWEETSFVLTDLTPHHHHVVRVCSARGAAPNGGPDPTACAPDIVVLYDNTTVPPGMRRGPQLNGCTGGKVWRWAFEGDRVCVEQARVHQVIADNAEADARRSPDGAPTGRTPASRATSGGRRAWRIWSA